MAWKTKADMVESAAKWEEDVALKLRVLEHAYGKYAEKWENAIDDRYLVYSTYHLIVDALKSIKPPINVYVLVALNDHIRKDRELMDRIIARFKEVA